MSHKERTAIVTGAAHGIGRAIATALLDAGAQVLAVDMDGDTLQEQYGEAPDAATLIADVSSPTAPHDIIESVQQHFGKLDYLVNNAGIVEAGPFETLTDEQWDHIMGVNVRSIFRLSRAALPLLKASDKASIINLGSIMSDMAGPNLSIYGTSKHAVAGLTKGMAVDLGPMGITVNYLQPGSIVTKMSEPFMDDPAFKKYWEDKAPVGRLGQPGEVAAAALFLLSDEARFITGLGLNVDGGAIVNF